MESIADFELLLGRHMRKNNNGIWIKEDIFDEVHYPGDAHGACFQVEDASVWYKHRNKCIASMLRVFPPKGLLLDIGGGNGLVSRYLMDKDVVETVLVEPGKEGALNAAEKRKLSCVVNVTADSLDFLQEKIPAIGLFDVLEHIEDEVNFLLSLRKMLVKTGKIYITVPAHLILWSATDFHAGHFRRYRKATLNAVLEKSGFRTLYCSGIFKALIPGIFIFRSIKSIWGFRRRIDLSNDKNSREHGVEDSIAWRIAGNFLKGETEMILKKKTQTGASLICVAEKNEGQLNN